MSEYKHPEVLVTTEWAAGHLNDPKVRLIEVDVDTTAYDQGHIPGAVGWNWQTQLQDNIRRDLIDKATLEALLGKSGVGTTRRFCSTATITTGSRHMRCGS
jgi:thiosulfate/3-mercaptopyruvate sulfurtransferase